MFVILGKSCIIHRRIWKVIGEPRKECVHVTLMSSSHRASFLQVMAGHSHPSTLQLPLSLAGPRRLGNDCFIIKFEMGLMVRAEAGDSWQADMLLVEAATRPANRVVAKTSPKITFIAFKTDETRLYPTPRAAACPARLALAERSAKEGEKNRGKEEKKERRKVQVSDGCLSYNKVLPFS